MRWGSWAFLIGGAVHCGMAEATGQEGQCSADAPETCKVVKEEGIIRTIFEDMDYHCPPSRPLRWLIETPIMKGSSFLPYLFKAREVEWMTEDWADDYTVVAYNMVGMQLSVYKTRTAQYVKTPTKMGTNETIRAGNIYTPHFDVDATPNFFWFEDVIPGYLWSRYYVPALTCFYGAERQLKFEDTLDDQWKNTWEAALKSGRFKRKVDWVSHFFDPYTGWDGVPMWPKQMVNFANLYFKNDEWDDGLESAIAFQLIGAHRVEVSDKVFAGEKLPFVVKLNEASLLEVRPHFGRYGGDLYFTAEGLPAMIVTTDNREVKRGDKDWQYWKFVWRSSLVTLVTLADHLHLTHFRVANLLSRNIRLSLPPDHVLRRFLTIFTFGSIFVNLQAVHQLIGPSQLLNRAVPFKGFEGLSELVPSSLEDTSQVPAMKVLAHEELWKDLPQKLKESPFYADGKLIFTAIVNLLRNLMKIIGPSMCDKEGHVIDPNVQNLLKIVFQTTSEAHYKLPEGFSGPENATCNMAISRLAVYIFIVTGFHRHVGFVGDYYKDPELASMSWKEGERWGRPRQHMLMAVVAIFTATNQPKLIEDFSHVFEGLPQEAEIKEMWQKFRDELEEIRKEVERRNKKRPVPNYNMDPTIIECSVAK